MVGAPVLIEVLDRATAVREGPKLLAMNENWDYWTMDHLLQERELKWHLSRIAWQDDAPIGYAIVSRRSAAAAHLHHIVIAPQLRGSGMGSRLLGSVACAAAEAGHEVLSLKVASTNERAVKLYRSLGFMEDGLSESGLLEMRARLSDLRQRLGCT